MRSTLELLSGTINTTFNIKLFSYDTSLTLSSKCPVDLQNNVTTALVSVANWFKSNKLAINYDKTEYIIGLITNKKLRHQFDIAIS